ncbi:hypothetical protein U4960_00610 [Altererythrobacter sp. H2]|uniref:hypothetical protein n=1 Tax=Altererythrobacter sp. H2 TaxID=3108391 RepID=UPI002B4BBFFC|nr:hypothetical protein [Altererythrobacter sp. H2]WRK95866.1 hypothetical protein U4960_00610 [Altererythrobacter sp. H2]
MIIKLAALAGIGYAGYKYYEKNHASSTQPAFAGNQGDATIRTAGADSMRDKQSGWTKTDEELDQSFPASDPPANY